MLFAVVGILNLSVDIGVMLRGSSEVISAGTGGLLSAALAIAMMTAIFVLYGVAGGLSAAIITDFIQGVLTIAFSFLLLPFIMGAVGGMSGIRVAIDHPAKLSLVAPAEIGFFYIAIIALNGLVGIVTQSHAMGNCAAGRAGRGALLAPAGRRRPGTAHPVPEHEPGDPCAQRDWHSRLPGRLDLCRRARIDRLHDRMSKGGHG